MHARFDRALARLTSPLGLLYPQGFGADLDTRVAQVRAHVADDAVVDIEWTRPRRRLGIEVRSGSFRSPAAAALPAQSARAQVEHWRLTRASPTCLILAATAEEGTMRRRPLARWLASQGIASLILENPFYGARRPSGQRGPLLRTVADQFAMNLATVVEACALLRTFHLQGCDVGVTGYSQGGVMAAFAGALSPFSVALVPRGAACSVEPVFTAEALSQSMHWDVLAREAGGIDAARRRFAEALTAVRLDRHPPPHDPARAILVSSRDDGFIPPREAERLHAHWPGSELRWTQGGHITGLVLHHGVHRKALLDAFARAPAGARP